MTAVERLTHINAARSYGPADRIAITAAVMAFITVLAACLIFIQIATFRASARAAASAAMDAASANTLSRLEADITELSALVRVLSKNSSLTDSDDRTEIDGAIALFKAALHELPQADSLHVGYENGCWLQVRRLDVLDATERRRLVRLTALSTTSTSPVPRPSGRSRCVESSRTSAATSSRSSIFGITATTFDSVAGTAIRSAQTGR